MSRFATTIGSIFPVVLVMFLAPLLTSAQGQTGGAQPGGAAPAARTAGETFKNVQVLKDIPADQFLPTMRFVAASLGAQCTFCHVEDANDSDDKQTKQTARRMMQMVMNINKDNFNGRVTVTCYTCHRGSDSPVGTPLISDSGAPTAPLAAAGEAGRQPPPAAELIDRYLQALGGADAIAKITTRVAKGTVTTANGQAVPVEIYVKAPDKRLMITHAANGDRAVGYNGNIRLASPAGGPGGGGDLEGVKLEDDLYLAANAKSIYTQWRAGRPEKVGDRDAYVLNGSAAGHPPIRLYIDQQNGMLLRMMHFTETALGRLPARVDYADYRAVNGVQVPFKITLAGTNSRTTIQLDQVQQNLAVDDAKFAPAPSPAPAP